MVQDEDSMDRFPQPLVLDLESSEQRQTSGIVLSQTTFGHIISN